MLSSKSFEDKQTESGGRNIWGSVKNREATLQDGITEALAASRVPTRPESSQLCSLIRVSKDTALSPWCLPWPALAGCSEPGFTTLPLFSLNNFFYFSHFFLKADSMPRVEHSAGLELITLRSWPGLSSRVRHFSD